MAQEPLKFVFIGLGTIYPSHVMGLESIGGELVAVCDIDPEVAKQRSAERGGIPYYTDHKTMLAEVKADVASVMTPHPSHSPIAIDCLEAGLHVICEKPMADHIAAADAAVEAAQRAGKLLAVNFQQRLRPEVIKARELLEAGEVGTIQYVHMIADWPRTAVYFGLSNWRGTWTGEGAGVLLNQSPHDLDLLCYLIGMPACVVAWTPTRFHKIEVEDTIHAMIEWPGGAFGFMHSSTAEVGHPASQLEILGTKGRIVIGKGEVQFTRLEQDAHEFMNASRFPFAAPSREVVPVEITRKDDTGHPQGGIGHHVDIYQNFRAALLDGAPLAAPGASGRRSLELANGMTYSHFTGQAVEFPLDRAAYKALLDELRAGRR
ncbi:MAG: Gfo/Idh/MocA family oxidoreductase [Anaerolineae bacterium]|nr:Gfo/Idh/MocA family oxidoreductase [Anaerolineae bacterium]